MNVDDVQRLYAYNDWANERFLAAAAALAPEQLTRTLVSSYPTVRDTVAHIAFAEWLWLERWQEKPFAGMPAWIAEGSLDALADQMRQTARERKPFLAGLRDALIESVIRYRSTDGDDFEMILRDLLVHCANHSTYHRGQLVTMLRQVGATPPNSDYTQFVRSTRTEPVRGVF